jgi:hypothetical protein
MLSEEWREEKRMESEVEVRERNHDEDRDQLGGGGFPPNGDQFLGPVSRQTGG